MLHFEFYYVYKTIFSCLGQDIKNQQKNMYGSLVPFKLPTHSQKYLKKHTCGFKMIKYSANLANSCNKQNKIV